MPVGDRLSAADGHIIRVRAWQTNDAAPRAALQVVHGLADHSARYARFARHCNEWGYVVFAHDHRGHGAPSDTEVPGHFADRHGWRHVIADTKLVHDAIRAAHPDLPLLVLGHSMGSYIAQHFVMQHPEHVAALLLSGSTLARRLQVRVGRWLALLERLRHGPAQPSARLNALGFGAFNRRFEPVRTEFDWLSRDKAEVDRYIADPHCGAAASAGLWCDLLGGLLGIGTAKALRRIPAQMPILITGGALDPVGGSAGMQRLADAYERSGHDNVTLKIYPDARHEMLHETNREEFTRDVLKWMDGVLAAGRANGRDRNGGNGGHRTRRQRA